MKILALVCWLISSFLWLSYAIMAESREEKRRSLFMLAIVLFNAILCAINLFIE